jgi:hypothetical protein
MQKKSLSLLTSFVCFGFSSLSAETDIFPALQLEREKQSFLHFEREGAETRHIIEILEKFQSSTDDKKKRMIEEQKQNAILIRQRLEYKAKMISDAIDAAGLGEEAVRDVEKLARDFLNKNAVKGPKAETIVEVAFKIGSDVENFAKKGDVIWQVRLGPEKSGMLWINPRTHTIQALGIIKK